MENGTMDENEIRGKGQMLTRTLSFKSRTDYLFSIFTMETKSEERKTNRQM